MFLVLTKQQIGVASGYIQSNQPSTFNLNFCFPHCPELLRYAFLGHLMHILHLFSLSPKNVCGLLLFIFMYGTLTLQMYYFTLIQNWSANYLCKMLNNSLQTHITHLAMDKVHLPLFLSLSVKILSIFVTFFKDPAVLRK